MMDAQQLLLQAKEREERVKARLKAGLPIMPKESKDFESSSSEQGGIFKYQSEIYDPWYTSTTEIDRSISRAVKFLKSMV